MNLRVSVNAERVELPAAATVAVLVETCFAGHRWLAVAVEGEVVPRRDWAAVELRDGASVEVLTAVQGG